MQQERTEKWKVVAFAVSTVLSLGFGIAVMRLTANNEGDH
jgi:hypothetical protein